MLPAGYDWIGLLSRDDDELFDHYRHTLEALGKEKGVLEKNAQDTKSGAGQYFTPRALIEAIVDVMQPQPCEAICDPACGTGDRFNLILTNLPFGKKSSTTIIGEDGNVSKEKESIERDDFWATTSNKQLNFMQHVKTLLKQNGRAAVVVPDNVLFEGGPGETHPSQAVT